MGNESVIGIKVAIRGISCIYVEGKSQMDIFFIFCAKFATLTIDHRFYRNVRRGLLSSDPRSGAQVREVTNRTDGRQLSRGWWLRARRMEGGTMGRRELSVRRPQKQPMPIQMPPGSERARVMIFFSPLFFTRGCNVQEAVPKRGPQRHLRLGHGRGAVPAAQGERS